MISDALKTYYDALIEDEPPAHLLELIDIINSEPGAYDLSGRSSDTRQQSSSRKGAKHSGNDTKGSTGR